MSKEKTKTVLSPEGLLLGYLCIKDLDTLWEQVELLDRFALSGADISKICNCSEQAVKDARYKRKSSRSKTLKSSTSPKSR